MRRYAMFLMGLALPLALLVVSCTDEDGPTEPPVPSGEGAPLVAIQEPTSDISYVTTQDAVTLSGLASDEGTLTSVAWSTDRGHSGSASATGSPMPRSWRLKSSKSELEEHHRLTAYRRRVQAAPGSRSV